MSYSNISCLRVFNEETGLLEYTLLGLVSAGVESVDVYTFIPNNEVTYNDKFSLKTNFPIKNWSLSLTLNISILSLNCLISDPNLGHRYSKVPEWFSTQQTRPRWTNLDINHHLALCSHSWPLVWVVPVYSQLWRWYSGQVKEQWRVLEARLQFWSLSRYIVNPRVQT